MNGVAPGARLLGLVRNLGLGLLALMGVSCVPEVEPKSMRMDPKPPAEFAFYQLDGSLLSAAQLRGRRTVLLFGATWDLDTQTTARRLIDLSRIEAPKINAAIVLMEPPKNLELAQAFADVVQPGFPVVLADPDTLAGRGVFPIRMVPLTAVLNEEGVLVAVEAGLMNLPDLRKLLSYAD